MVKRDIKTAPLVKKFHSLYLGPEEDPEEEGVLTALVGLFSSLSAKKEFQSLYPEFGALYDRVLRAVDQGKREDAEVNLVQLYCYLHSFDMGYTEAERQEVDACGGYWCHAGGIMPLVKAGPFITPEARVADYGAGNGLQGLLFQHLYPHLRTTQIEISQKMIASGRRLQALMEIPQQRVEWLHRNVMHVPPDRFDFIYMYRPVRPSGVGRAFYEKFAAELDRVEHRVVLFSIADCLKDFLGAGFRMFYDDGHLACFSNEGLHGPGPGERKSSPEG